MRPLYTGSPSTGGDPHVGLICGNLTPPLGDRPALLNHQEVETLFHEFGHLMHHLLTDVPVRSLAGTNVAWDFVELPSQIMENWTWERAALDLFARHHETGEPLPAALFDRMVAARCFRSADAQMRQLGFATLDLRLHRELDPMAGVDVVAYARDVLAEFTAAPLPDDFALVTSFNHLFASPTGYAAAYYSYKWAEVLDADAFGRFRGGALFSREVGTAFRQTILARGNSDDPAALFHAFMGRDPDPEALMARAGLLG
ncbi:MAG: M3 family metallopeptidase [bacterium]